MPEAGFFYLGRILKTHGNTGSVVVFLDVDDPSEYENLESVYLDLHGERVPFFIRSLELRQNGKAVVRFQDFDTADDAETLPGLKMYLPAADLPELKGRKFYYHEVTGFRVIDATHGDIGVVDSVLDLPHQALFRVMHGEREILIPVVDEVIRKVDRKKRQLMIEAPEGLIELYL